jgi:signal transduction histidine kinase
MDKIQREIKKVQKRDWQLWSLMIFLFLIFTSFIVLIIFYSDLQDIFSERIDAFMFNFLVVGFVALSLLFIGYIVVKEIAVKKLQKYLVEERIVSQVLEKRFGELTALFELSNLVNSQLDLSAILDIISSKALRCLGGNQSSLFLYDSQKNRLRCVSVWGPEHELVKNAEIEIGKSVAGWVMKHGKPLHLGEDLEAYQFTDFVKKRKKITSSLCVPLMVKNKAKGVLNVNLMEQVGDPSAGGDRKFTEIDLKLISIFAENAAIAIEKAELYAELKNKTETLEKTIEELKATQDQLIQSAKLASLGELVSKMAHEVNNPLMIISGNAQLCLMEELKDKNLEKNLKVIVEQTDRAKDIIQRLLLFSRSSRGEITEVNINEALEFVIKLVEHQYEISNIRIIRDYGSGLPAIKLDSKQMQQVFMNLIRNSADAMPEGGSITVSSFRIEDKLAIVVKDTGHGIAKENFSKLFEPFFTTKPKGTGLGLSVSYGIVRAHGGEIKFESEPGRGTTATVLLPIGGGKA